MEGFPQCCWLGVSLPLTLLRRVFGTGSMLFLRALPKDVAGLTGLGLIEGLLSSSVSPSSSSWINVLLRLVVFESWGVEA